MIDLFLFFLPSLAAISILPSVAALAWLRPRWFTPPAAWWRAFESAWRSLARRPVLAVSLLCLIQLAGVGVRWAFIGIPAPHVHDEFSYLLAGGTFASGRMTNPTHPMWVHFESPHIIHIPSYMSFYPPGQSVALALGFLLGHPWIGVILSTLLMIALIYWSARQWLSPFWALPAGIFGLCLVLCTYWTDTYWGGAVNAIAGALVVGAAGALRRRPSAWQLMLFAAGASLCAITRPFEGLVLTLLISGWLLWRIVKRGPAVVRSYLRVSLPAVLLLAVSAGVFCYYNYRVTGSPLTMPYSEGARQYLARRKFIFESDPPIPAYRHKELRDTYVRLRRTSLSQHWRLYGNLRFLAVNYLSIPLLPLFLLSASLALYGWRGKVRPLILTATGGVAAVLTVPWINPHYYAPFAVPLIVAVVASLRLLRAVRLPGGRSGWVVVAVAVCLLAAHAAQNVALEVAPPPDPAYAWGIERHNIEQRLIASPQPDLVIVRYQPDHDWYHEWVYNHADIDAAPVVWAREMGAAQDVRLLDYFKSRRAWLLEADVTPPRLTPYPVPAVTPPAP